MALEFGFGRFEDDPIAQRIWHHKFEALSNPDKKFFHEFLPTIMMTVGICCVSEDTIPHIKERLKLVHPDWVMEINQDTSISIEEYLKRFIGFSCNVRTISKKEFVDKVTSIAYHKIPNLSEEEARKSCTLLVGEKLLIKEASIEELPLLINRRWVSKVTEDLYKQRITKGA